MKKLILPAIIGCVIALSACQKKPTACFNCEEIGQACPLGHKYEFTNCSTEATTYEWDFGDGGTSTLAAPDHCYASGTYTVRLSAFSENGRKEDETSQTITVQ